MDEGNDESVPMQVCFFFNSSKDVKMVPTQSHTAQIEEEKSSLPVRGSNNDEVLKADSDAASEVKKEAKAAIASIPTNDAEVKKLLRQLKEPICLFGEDADTRRERLKRTIENQNAPKTREGIKEQKESKQAPPKDKSIKEDELFYTRGSEELKAARTQIAFYSIPKASLR
eukprot:TRINITY_DN5237_c0_g1_i1.p1 TRINITY_DN5237_c0_g1~~TRINITY_DN5237_c0_g1_i1.p1  ORF type:complete len:171 (-),score=32.85 TRINITY_DN5237_c0_g1_i1:620-1132(-)